MEYKTFFKAISTNNMHTGESFFAAFTFEDLQVFSFQIV